MSTRPLAPIDQGCGKGATTLEHYSIICGDALEALLQGSYPLGMAPSYELAQVNIALAREPLDAPLLAEFMALLDPVNARADGAPGFVWRMQTEDGNATGLRGFGDDPRLIINLSVWKTLEAMRKFVYQDPEHVRVMRKRRSWFERLDLYTALWWVPTGHRPSIAEAESRLEHLREHGPSPAAFTFRHHFDSPTAVDAHIDEYWHCGV